MSNYLAFSANNAILLMKSGGETTCITNFIMILLEGI
jgi:hypothetical protein